MELNLKKQPVDVCETLYDGVTEQPIECDVLLPDYCPDIQTILRCEVTPALLSHMVSSDRLTLEGMATAHVYYRDEQGCLGHAEYKIPYSKSLELRSQAQNPTASISQTVDYFNCRSVSPRRLDMRGAVSISVKITGRSQEQVVTAADGLGIQLKSETVENTALLPPAARSFSLQEELELGYGKPAVGSVVRYSAQAQVSDYKVLDGKLVTKGELALKILYQCEEDPKKLEMMEYSLPLSQIIEVPGVDEDCSCSVWYDVCTLEITPKRASDGENRIFAAAASLNACCSACRRVSLEAACDCYSTQYECTGAPRRVQFLSLLGPVSESCQVKETLTLPEGTKGVMDLWCSAGQSTVLVEDDCVTVSGKLTVGMFLTDSSDCIAYQEDSCAFSHKVPLRQTCEAVLFTPRVTVGMAAFTFSGGGQLEMRCPVGISGMLFKQFCKQVLCDAAVDETREKPKKDAMLYLYYAGRQEPVWEIAKRYNTSVEAIMKGNLLEGAVLDGNKMLLIPVK